MFPSKDGKKYGSAYVAKKRDAMHGMGEAVMHDTDKHEAAETPEFERGEQEGQKEAPEQNENPSQVVAEHGPANTVHVAHDHKAKKHHVVSTHADGHVHESNHGSAKEAHDHAAQLAAAETQPEGQPAAGAASAEADGFPMPRLA